MDIKEVINLLFELRDNFHIAHLQTPKYSEHTTLGMLYEEIGGCLDEFVELCQGIKGEVVYEIGNISVKEGVDINSYIKDSITKLEEYREKSDHFLLGIKIEEILMLLYKGLYLLKLEN